MAASIASNPNIARSVNDVKSGVKGADQILAQEVDDYIKEKEGEVSFWQGIAIIGPVLAVGAGVVGYVLGRSHGRADVMGTIPGSEQDRSLEALEKVDDAARWRIFNGWWS